MFFLVKTWQQSFNGSSDYQLGLHHYSGALFFDIHIQNHNTSLLVIIRCVWVMLVAQHGLNYQQNCFLLLIIVVSQDIVLFKQLMHKCAISLSITNGAIGIRVGTDDDLKINHNRDSVQNFVECSLRQLICCFTLIHVENLKKLWLHCLIVMETSQEKAELLAFH